MKIIPNGTQVWFVRGYDSPYFYAATVVGSYRLRIGHHYALDVIKCPFTVGFANDDEVFVDFELALAAAHMAAVELTLQRRAHLTKVLRGVEAEIASLNWVVSPSDLREAFEAAQ